MTVQSKGRACRQRGDAAERKLVEMHKEIGCKAERVPLSGSAGYQGKGHDVDIYAFGPDAAPMICEVKKRKGGGGFVQIESWLADHDALFLMRDRADPLVVLPWRVWKRFAGTHDVGADYETALAALRLAPKLSGLTNMVLGLLESGQAVEIHSGGRVIARYLPESR